MGSSLRPPSLQRSKSNAGPSRPPTPSHHPTIPVSQTPEAQPARPRTPNIPHRLNTIGGTASERPPLPTRSSTLPHARNASVPFVPAVDDDNTRRRLRMMQEVAFEVDAIDKETEEKAKRNLENIRKSIRRRGSINVEPPTPIRMAEENGFPQVRRTQSRRGSVDSAVAGGWKPIEMPRKSKDWERWAENRVQNRRRLDEIWKNEDEVVNEAKRLIQETRAQEKLRQERNTRKEWERQAFIEQVRVILQVINSYLLMVCYRSVSVPPEKNKKGRGMTPFIATRKSSRTV